MQRDQLTLPGYIPVTQDLFHIDIDGNQHSQSEQRSIIGQAPNLFSPAFQFLMNPFHEIVGTDFFQYSGRADR